MMQSTRFNARLLGALALCCLLCAGPVLAATFQINSTTGAPTGPVFDTVNNALNNCNGGAGAAPGDIFEITDTATYTEDVLITTSSITLRTDVGTAGGPATIVSGAANVALTSFGVDGGLVVAAADVVLEDLILQTSLGPPDFVTLSTDGATFAGASVTCNRVTANAAVYTVANALGAMTFNDCTIAAQTGLTQVTFYNYGSVTDFNNTDIQPADAGTPISLYNLSGTANVRNGSTVSGSAAGWAIVSSDASLGPAAVTLDASTASGASNYMIQLDFGTLDILNGSTVSGAAFANVVVTTGAGVNVDGSTISGGATGIEVRNGTLTLNDAHIDGNSGSGILRNTSVGSTTITSSTLNNNGTAITAVATGDYLIDGGTVIDGNSGDGIVIQGASSDVTLDGCTISNSGLRAIEVSAAASTLTLTASTINTTGEQGIVLDAGASNSKVNLTNVDIVNTNWAGIQVLGATDGSVFNLTDCNITGVQDPNADGILNGSLSNTYNVSGGSISSNGRHGFNTDTPVSLNLSEVTMDGNGATAIRIHDTADNFSWALGAIPNLNLTSCSLTNNGSDAISMAAPGILTMTDCLVDNNTWAGIWRGLIPNDGSTDHPEWRTTVTLTNTTFSNSANGAGIVAVDSVQRWTITGCTFENNNAEGIYSNGFHARPTGDFPIFKVSKTRFIGGGDPAFSLVVLQDCDGGGTPAADIFTGTYFENCLFDSAQNAFKAFNSAAVIWYSTLVSSDSGQTAVLTDATYTDVQVSNSIIEGYGTAFSTLGTSSIIEGANIVNGINDATTTNALAGFNRPSSYNVSPGFVTPSTGPGTGDFQLTWPSSAIGGARSFGLVTSDLDGNARPGGAYLESDMGAFEFQGSRGAVGTLLVPGDGSNDGPRGGLNFDRLSTGGDSALDYAIAGDTIQITDGGTYPGFGVSVADLTILGPGTINSAGGLSYGCIEVATAINSLTVDNLTLSGGGAVFLGFALAHPLDLNVTSTTIQGMVLGGAWLTSLGPAFTSDSDLSFANCTIDNSSAAAGVGVAGIAIGNISGQNASLSLSEGTSISGGGVPGIVAQPTTATSSVDVVLDNATLTGTGDYGILFFGDMGVSTCTIRNGSVVSDTNYAGFDANSSTSPDLTISVSDSEVRGNGNSTAGLGIQTSRGPVTLNLTNALIHDNEGVGLTLLGEEGMSVVLDNTQVTSNSADGMVFTPFAATSTFDLDILNGSKVEGNRGSGFYTNASTHDLDITVADSSLSSNTRFSGLEIAGVPGSVLLSVSNATLANNATYGMWLHGSPVSAQLSLVDSQFDGNTINGLRMSETPGDIQLDVSGGSFDGNSEAGVYYEVTTANQLTATVSGASFSNNTLDGWYQYVPSGGAVTMDLDGCTVEGNGRQGIWDQGATGGLDLTMSGCLVRDNNYGLLTGWTLDSPGTVTLTETDLIENAATGFVIGVPTSQIEASLVECSLSGNLLDGVGIEASGASPGTRRLSLTSCTLNNNVGTAFFPAGDGVEVNATNCDLSGNGQFVVYSTSPESTMNLTSCTVDHSTAANFVFRVPDLGASTSTLNVVGCDFLTTGIAVIPQTSGTLVADFRHSTFHLAAGAPAPTWFTLSYGNADSALTFDQCDFVNGNAGGQMSILWAQTSANNGGKPDWPGTVDVRDCILVDGGFISDVPDTRMTQDFNLQFGTGGFGSTASAEAGDGWSSATGSTIGGDPQYRSTVFGDANYLLLGPGSPAIGLNSGNGSEDYAGAKGYSGYVEPVSPTAARDWYLY